MATTESDASHNESNQKPVKFRLGRFFCALILSFITLGALLATLMALLARLHWMLELMTHFTVYIAIAWFFVTLGWLSLRSYRAAGVCSVGLACYVWQIAPFYLPTNVPSATGETIRVLSQNVYADNFAHEKVIDLIERENPDVFILIETRHHWIKAIEPLETEYRLVKHVPSRGAFGLSLYSRIKFDSIEVVRLGEALLPSIVVRFNTSTGPMQLIATHTVPPLNPRNAHCRNDELQVLATYVRNSNVPTLLVGDMNITPWSPYFHDLLRDGQLLNTQHGHGVTPTWYFKQKVGIPIDHALVTPGIGVSNRRVGPHVNSDHRGIVFDFSVLGAKK